MNRIVLTILSAAFLINTAFAQRKTPELDKQKVEEQKQANETYGSNDSWKDKMIYGGNICATFGNQSSYFLVQPIVGYKLTDKIQVGISPLYIYSSGTYTFSNKKQIVSAYGPGVFGRYFINENIFAHTEYLGLSYNYENELTNLKVSRFSNSLFVGGGYMPGGAGAYFVALYDVLYSKTNSFYSSPFDFRVGFVF